MRSQLGRRLAFGCDDAGEDLGPSVADGVFAIGVEARLTRVRVDGHLDRVAQVVRPVVERLRVRVVVRRRIGVEDPHDPAVDDRGVGALVVLQPRCDLACPGLDGAVEENLAVRLEVVREEHLIGSQTQRPQHALDKGTEAHAAGGFVPVRGVGTAVRVVELIKLGVHDRVVGSARAVVDAGLLGDEFGRSGRDVACDLRRNVADEEAREAARCGVAGRGDRQSVAVRVDEVLVDPGPRLRGQSGGVDLAGRDEHLLQHSVHGVAVGVDLRKPVVRANRLQLRVGLLDRAWLPDPGLAHLVGGSPGCRGRHGLRRRVRLGVDVLEIERSARHVYVSLDVGRLQGRFIWCDHVALHDRRPDRDQHDACRRPSPEGEGGRLPVPRPRGNEEQHRNEDAQRDHDPVRGELGVHVGVGRAHELVARGVGEAPHLDPEVECDREHEHAEQDRDEPLDLPLDVDDRLGETVSVGNRDDAPRRA